MVSWYSKFPSLRSSRCSQKIFEWIATHLPGAYGLLYVHDDEAGDDINENRFLVWKLARGQLEKVKDPFLSPYIPVVEDSYDPSRDD
ncbi:Imm7 family immunity protein [Paenibacillus pabuli]|uniref:Imm7 family immunity protein n=1 Tax=Paenibacillus pabuli TaxID=1472 RepID=UPI003D6C5B5D